jgi:hypothetical protein
LLRPSSLSCSRSRSPGFPAVRVGRAHVPSLGCPSFEPVRHRCSPQSFLCDECLRVSVSRIPRSAHHRRSPTRSCSAFRLPDPLSRLAPVSGMSGPFHMGHLRRILGSRPVTRPKQEAPSAGYRARDDAFTQFPACSRRPSNGPCREAPRFARLPAPSASSPRSSLRDERVAVRRSHRTVTRAMHVANGDLPIAWSPTRFDHRARSGVIGGCPSMTAPRVESTRKVTPASVLISQLCSAARLPACRASFSRP